MHPIFESTGVNDVMNRVPVRYDEAVSNYDDADMAREWDEQFKAKRERYGNREEKEKVQFIVELGKIRKDSRVLSVGCGTGNHEELIDCGDLVCFDIAREMLKVARGKDLEAVQGSAFTLPFPDSSFDCVFAINLSTLHYDPQSRNRTIREMKRVLKRRGRIITITANEVYLKALGLLRYRNMDFDTYRVRTSVMKKAFLENGLIIERCFCIQYLNFFYPRLDRALTRFHLDFLGHWLVSCVKKHEGEL